MARFSGINIILKTPLVLGIRCIRDINVNVNQIKDTFNCHIPFFVLTRFDTVVDD